MEPTPTNAKSFPPRQLRRKPVAGSWRPDYREELVRWKAQRVKEEQKWKSEVSTLLRLECRQPEEIAKANSITSSTASLPKAASIKKPDSASKLYTHVKSSGYSNQPSSGGRQSSKSQPQLLDGFCLLSACKVDDPVDAASCVINEKDLTQAEENDFKLFTSLAYLDLGDNRLQLHMLGAFPNLQELHLYCNMISEIQPLSGFSQLQYLDLSFNFINPECLIRLADIPRLKVLDLTGNALKWLPGGLEVLARLERLVLEDNQMNSTAALLALQNMPKLKELDLSDNQLTGFPMIEETGFPALEFINLSSNMIRDEDQLTTLSQVPNVQEVLIWNNPLVSKSRGEKPFLNKLRRTLVDELGIYVMIEPPPTMKSAPIIFDPSSMAKVVDEFSQLKPVENTGANSTWELSQQPRTSSVAPGMSTFSNMTNRQTQKEAAGDFFLTQDPNQDPDDDAMLREEERLFQAHLAAFQAREAELEAYAPDRTSSVGVAHFVNDPQESQHAAYAALKLALENPVVHPPPDANQRYLLPTNAAALKTKPRVKREKRTARTKTDRSGADEKDAVSVSQVEQVLDTMKKRLEVVEQNLAAVLHNENVLKEFPQSIRLLERAQREFDKLKSTPIQPLDPSS